MTRGGCVHAATIMSQCEHGFLGENLVYSHFRSDIFRPFLFCFLWYTKLYMKLRTIRECKDLEGKKVLLRVAYDVPLKKQGRRIVVGDDRRIRETVPTIEYLLKHHCAIGIMSWLKRPGGKVVPGYRMDPVATRLAQILKRPVKKLDDCIGPKVYREIQQLQPGKILMLENVRFYPQEEENDRHFARLLVHGFDLIAFDAFGQAHRVHASTTGITKLRPSYAGFLLEQEVAVLEKIAHHPRRPFVVILGGAKISDKIATLQHLVKKADHILIGGGPANIFLKAQGVPIGKSFVEDVFVDKAKHRRVDPVKIARQLYKAHPHKFVLPVDYLSANTMSPHALVEVIDFEKKQRINPSWHFLDIGPKTVASFLPIIKNAKTIFWNGPMGVFELHRFSFGTRKIAEAVSRSKAVSVIGGGDTESIVSAYHLEGKFTHVSTGGGASLEFLAGKELPALMTFIK